MNNNQESGQLSNSKRQRRKRTDDEGRTFTCRCGKSYLSYPALYTHIKTKHAEEPLSRLTRSYEGYDSPPYPDRVQRSQIQKQKQLQRQKQRQKQRQRQRQKQKQLQDNFPIYGNSLPQVNNIQVLKQFLFKYFPNIVVNSNHNYKNQMTILEKKQLKQMKEYWNNRKRQDQVFNQVYQTPIKYVMGKFMLELESQVQNISFKKYIFLFTFAIKKALQKIKQDQEYFKSHNASQLPGMFDQILRQHLLPIDNNDFLSNPTVAAKTLYYFGRWLYVNKFTNLSLKYNF